MDILIFVEALVLAVLALVTLAFTISSLWEREERAALIGGVTFLILLGGEIGLFALRAGGFFESTPGFLILLLGLVIPVAVLLLWIRIGRNQRALQGTKWHSQVEAERRDVFRVLGKDWN
jgi:predicted tellurium resistance membrane protein TerC